MHTTVDHLYPYPYKNARTLSKEKILVRLLAESAIAATGFCRIAAFETNQKVECAACLSCQHALCRAEAPETCNRRICMNTQ